MARMLPKVMATRAMLVSLLVRTSPLTQCVKNCLTFGNSRKGMTTVSPKASNMTSNIMKQLINHGEVQRGQLGVMIQDVTPQLADIFKLST